MDTKRHECFLKNFLCVLVLKKSALCLPISLAPVVKGSFQELSQLSVESVVEILNGRAFDLKIGIFVARFLV